ncbi:type VI secretion system protein TssA [Janthinobacterium aquaticum]|uniref:type VI secretion system protein TssA n=1 Tax=Janthinobacterium sp. FT58W TaxID=2654254 RepID=UPI001D015ABB|nr:type VI secretion system protein TssA [Janthinobacterium sp. FT58W]
MNPPSLPIPHTLMSLEHQQQIDLLLRPISRELPCGPALRYDPVFTEIRLAREEDDPTLPMGSWERPLKRADWPLIEARCVDMLANRSKDLQIAAWLLEAWVRQSGFEGLYRGLSLIDLLVRQMWEPLHPLIEDNDEDARVAPLEWMNASLSATLRLHVPLLQITGRKPPAVTLTDWDRMIAVELAGPGHTTDNPGAEDAPWTRADVVAYAHQRLGREMAQRREVLKRCLNCLETMCAFVEIHLGSSSPNLSRLKGTLIAAERVLAQLMVEQAPEKTKEEIMAQASSDEQWQSEDGQLEEAQAAPLVMAGAWKNRKEAYATLEALADYLSAVEPHSPTPYLLRRAVKWGNMPLPELMAEIIREEGDLNRLANVLGLKE